MAEALGSSQAVIKVIAAAETDIGRRTHNEDAVLMRPDLGLYVLADGAGGENAGNVASTLACTSLAHFFEDTQAEAATMQAFDDLGLPTAARRLSIAVHRANRDIIEIAKSSDRYRGMGTTVVAAHVLADQGILHVAHVGDSRCYRLRDGRLEQITQDHTLVNDVLELKPDIPSAQAARLPRNVITRALGMEQSVRSSVRSLEIAPSDRFLLCSDGLTDVLDDARIHELLLTKATADAIVRRMIESAKEHGAQDNVAALVMVCDTPAGALPFRARPSPMLRVRRDSAPQMPAVRDPDLSWPEIIVVSEEPDDAPSAPAEPRESTTPGLLDAVDDFFESISPHRPGTKRKYHTLGYEDGASVPKQIRGTKGAGAGAEDPGTRKVAVAPPPDLSPLPPAPPAAPPPASPRASVPSMVEPRAVAPRASMPQPQPQPAPSPPASVEPPLPPAPRASIPGMPAARASMPAGKPKPTAREEVLCGECGASFDASLQACPDCGSARD